MYNSTPKFDEISYVKSFERVRATLHASELIDLRDVLQDAEDLRGKWAEALLRNFGKRQSSPLVFQLP
ncbi:hypothetical protein [Marinobacterium jannaschii]|uniref:hypothetical protein n=1 Tax=Marinobacterium jannaschii TaxID=64970 RepID=UPI00048989EE|nr:hypothetical protein [Marinobacterium jannaschii]